MKGVETADRILSRRGYGKVNSRHFVKKADHGYPAVRLRPLTAWVLLSSQQQHLLPFLVRRQTGPKTAPVQAMHRPSLLTIFLLGEHLPIPEPCPPTCTRAVSRKTR